MTPKAEYRVLFNRRKRKTSKDGRFPIDIEAYIPYARERRYLPTSIRITPEQWYTGKKESTYVNRKHPDYHNLNNRIRGIIKQFSDTEMSYFEKGIPFHLKYLSLTPKKAGDSSFIKYWEKFIDTNPKSFSKNHIKNNRSAIKHLKMFKEDISFLELTKKLLLDYEIHLVSYTYSKDNEKFNLSSNYIHNLFKDFQAAVNRAIYEEIIRPQDSPFLRFSFSRYKNMGESDIKYLTPEEVAQLENLDLSGKNRRLSITRDLFLLSCYTGLRFCDVTRLSRKHLTENENGGLTINIKQQKTGKPVSLPLHKLFDRKPYYIVKAWKATGRNELVRKMSNQYVNRNLKILAKLAGIEKHLTFHMARHTCGTGLVSRRIPLIVIRDIMGHSSITMTEKYAKLIPTDLEDQLENIIQ